MLKSLLSAPYASVLEQAMSASSLRHKVISNNIANVNTPGFKKSEVAFEQILQQNIDNGGNIPLSRTNAQHLPIRRSLTEIAPQIHTINNTSFRNDGNNVDVDIEMAEMAKNNIYYDAVAQQMTKYYGNLKSVINGGK
ncbi:MAG: flagellar basal body rod protein FlgB [Pelosinus sp.]|nr:flagellar basal body rod protein FlgB [Pelosinus sp.]